MMNFLCQHLLKMARHFAVGLSGSHAIWMIQSRDGEPCLQPWSQTSSNLKDTSSNPSQIALQACLSFSQ